MTQSGYNKKQRLEIINSGLIGYKRKQERAKRENKPLHKNLANRKARFSKKTRTKHTGFQSKTAEKRPPDSNNSSPPKRRRPNHHHRDERITNAAFFVPRTQDGMLCKQLREAETKLGDLVQTKIKVIS